MAKKKISHRSQVQKTPIPLHQSTSNCGQKENLSQVQSEQYHHQSLCTRVKYLKLSEVKTRSCHGAVVECRTRDPVWSKRSSQGSIPTNPTRVKYLSEVKTRSCHGAVVECRNQRSRVQTGGQKENLSQVQSEQYHHQSLSAPELNTSNCQR